MGHCVIVTRPRADSEALAVQLRAAGFDVVVAPLMRIELKAGAGLPDEAPQAIAFTSANGVAGLMVQEGASRMLGVPALAVGPASARAARDAGFGNVVTSGGDVTALVQTVRETCTPEGGAILYPSGVHISGDLAGELARLGFTVDRVEVYEAVHAGALPAVVADELEKPGDKAVVLYSPRSAAIWNRLAGAVDSARQGAQSITYVCLSGNVERALRQGMADDVRTLVAVRADDGAVMDALQAWRG